MITAIAWRNVWRNPRRSLVIIFSIIIGVASGIFLLGFFNGWTYQRLEDVVNTEISHIQVHDSAFLETEDVKSFMPGLSGSIEEIRKLEAVSGVSSQLVVNSMVKIAQENMGLKITGVVPESKAHVSDLPTRLIYGSWFQTDRSNPIVMSQRTAKRLGVIVYQLNAASIDSLRLLGLNEELAERLDTFATAPSLMRLNEYQFTRQLDRILGADLSSRQRSLIMDQAYFLRERIRINVLVQDTSGNFHEESFTLCGIFKTSNSLFDEMNVFVNRADLERMTGIGPDGAHEITILLKNDKDLDAVLSKVQVLLPDCKVRSWMQIDPVAKFYNDWMGSYTIIFMSVILLALFFGIVNTMLMAVLERIKEIGMLKAVGMNGRRVFRMILTESVFMTLIGSFIGIFLGLAIVGFFSVHPINLGVFAQGLEEFGFSAVITTYITVNDVVTITIMCVVTGILASVAPAVKAVRLRPVDAIRID